MADEELEKAEEIALLVQSRWDRWKVGARRGKDGQVIFVGKGKLECEDVYVWCRNVDVLEDAMEYLSFG